jgi:lipoprotein-releasing system permease protein
VDEPDKPEPPTEPTISTPPPRDTLALVESERIRQRMQRRRRNQAIYQIVIGVLLMGAGLFATFATYGMVAKTGGQYVVAYGPVVAGLLSLIRGIYQLVVQTDDELAADALLAPQPAQVDSELVLAQHRRRVIRGWIEVGFGAVAIVVGLVLLFKSPKLAMVNYIASWIPYVFGYLALVVGVLRLLNAEEGLVKPVHAAGKRNDLQIGFGFKSFVAWRYLMARHHRVSRIVLAVFFVALFVAVAGVVLGRTVFTRTNPMGLDLELLTVLARVALIATIASSALVFFTILIGLLRYVYSFFTTVPIVGVWIGTAALIIVLSVMSGFETDLRKKILGSNAHIQVTAESGDIHNWREIKARIDKVPGVLASTPYAVSEVVIAANNNGMNVLIKGIDPATVGAVTNLIDVIKDDGHQAMKRLAPLVTDETDLVVPPTPSGSGSGSVVDPPPDDMPSSGEPIDYSQPRGDSDAEEEGPHGEEPPVDPAPTHERGSAKKGSGARTGSAAAATADAGSFGGDAEYLVETQPIIDPPPADMVTSDDEPIDYSGGSGGDEVDLPIEVVDVPFDQGSLSKRTQSLPGILVGQELVKQTHLYSGEEVRVVSPLSDPSNPDATGTPIPFNRDYRVAGIFYTGMYEYDLKYVYVTLDSLQDFLDRGDVVDGIEIRISNPDETDEYVARLQSVLGKSYRVQDWKELNRSLFSALKLEKIAMFLVLGIVIIVASFSIVGNLIMVVVEKNREIALIKTLGAKNSTVMLVFAIQGLVIGLIGTGLGIGTGKLACELLEQFGFPLNPDVYYIDQLPVDQNTTSMLLTALAGIVISMLATLYPSVVAARVRPAAGMRH